jgi:transposase InsO family protein
MASESSMPSVKFTVLDARGSNFHTWRNSAKLELVAQGIWKFFDPTHPKSSSPARYDDAEQKKLDAGSVKVEDLKISADYEKWLDDSMIALGRLARLCDHWHASFIGSHSTPKACWDALVTRYGNRSAQGISILTQKLSSTRFLDEDSADIKEFFSEFDTLIDDLSRAGRDYCDEEICSWIALAMPSSLQPAVMSLQLQNGPDSFSPGGWENVLSSAWDRVKRVRATESTYVANRTVTYNTNSRDTCHVCQARGHYARDCPTLSPEERARRQEKARRHKADHLRSQAGGGSNNSNGGSSDMAAQLVQIQAKLAALETASHGESSSTGYESHAKVAILCASTSSLSEVPRVDCLGRNMDGDTVLKAGRGKIPANHVAIDSGASRHCASERAFFINYRNLAVPRKVFLGDDHFILAVGEGDFRVWVDGPSGEREGIVFSRTLHVPELACTLVSIRQLTQDVRPAVHVIFKGTACEVRNESGLVFRAIADHAAGGLYTLHLRTAPHPPTRNPVLALAAFSASKSSAALDPHVAHARFGHLNNNDLQALVRKRLVSNLSLSDRPHQSDPCEPCLLAKAHKLPFSPGSSRSTVLLNPVHTDVCGPFGVAALGGFRYFVTFRDDCTRLLRVYLLRNKSDAFERYKEFKAWAERSSGQRVRCLMSDRGGEFVSGAFECFLRDTGTVNQVSSPYTPEQNGAAERLNRDLLSIMRAALQDSGMAERFWGEAILYAGYTLNYQPNSTLDGELPYTAWTGKVPDVGHLRAFGCDAYVLIQPDSQR